MVEQAAPEADKSVEIEVTSEMVEAGVAVLLSGVTGEDAFAVAPESLVTELLQRCLSIAKPPYG